MARFSTSSIGAGIPGPQGPEGPKGEQGTQGEPGEDFTSFRGTVWRQASGTVNIVTANTYVPINLSGTLDSSISLGMSLSSTPNLSGLKNTSGVTRTVAVIATYDGKAGNNHAIGLKLAVNNVPLDETECTSFGGAGGQFGKTMTQWILTLDPNDEVTMWAANKDTSDNLTIARYKMIAFAV
jgi:hypothetical protein